MLAHEIYRDTGTAEIREVKKQVLLHTVHPKPGHTVFEYNRITGKLLPAEIKEVNAKLGEMGYGINKKIVTKDNCIYASALNKESALKKIVKLLKS